MSNDTVNISGRTVHKGMCLLSHWSVQTFVAGVDLLRVLCPSTVHSTLKSNCYSPSSFSLSFSSSSFSLSFSSSSFSLSFSSSSLLLLLIIMAFLLECFVR